MSVAGLTESKLRDARFRKIEEAIFKAFFEDESGMKLGVGELAQRIGVNRVTIYRHHRAVCEIVENYEKYILEKYVRLVQEIRGRGNVGLRRLYYETIIFILQNKKIFEVLLKRKKLGVIWEMILALRPDVELICESERYFRVYTGEIVGLIVDWELEGFKETEVVKLLNNITCVTDMIRERILLLES